MSIKRKEPFKKTTLNNQRTTKLFIYNIPFYCNSSMKGNYEFFSRS